MGGGPSPEQTSAAASQRRLTDQSIRIADQMNAREQDQYNQIKPYAFDRLKNGLPFFNQLTDFAGGTNARAFAPGRAQLIRRLGPQSLPSGFREEALDDYENARRRAFDANLAQNLFANEQSKSEAARLITGQQQVANPIGWTQAGMQGNQSIMQAPLAKPGLGGLIGGIAGGVASAIPF